LGGPFHVRKRRRSARALIRARGATGVCERLHTKLGTDHRTPRSSGVETVSNRASAPPSQRMRERDPQRRTRLLRTISERSHAIRWLSHQASLRQQRCSSSLRSGARTRRRRAYAPDATGPAKWRFRWSSIPSVSRGRTGLPPFMGERHSEAAVVVDAAAGSAETLGRARVSRRIEASSDAAGVGCSRVGRHRGSAGRAS
jgi:hypothetical protein